MSTPGLLQIWSLNVPLAGGLPQAPKFDIWVVNAILFTRAISNAVAVQLNAIPDSQTRLRDEGIGPQYSFARKLIAALESSARDQGVAVPAFPAAPADWSEDVSTDPKALAALLRPHMVEPIRVAMGQILGLRDLVPKIHWASAPAANSVALDSCISLVAEMDGVLKGSEWGPFKARITCDETKWFVRVMGEELLRIRAQPGSGWDEKEANEITKGQMACLAAYMTAGT